MMTLSCPVDLDLARLRAEVQSMYTRVATQPGDDFHFHRGPDYAARQLGYERAELDRLPAFVTASFAGVGNPHLIQSLDERATVLDMGSGAGTDLLLAAMHAPRGRAIGVDMTDSMIERARDGARAAGLHHVEVRAGDATALPVDDGSVDILISNGVFNLVPDKQLAMAEMFRVLRPGGRLQIADIALQGELEEAARHDVDLWAS